MSKRSQTSVKGKLKAVHLCLEQGRSIRTLARIFGVSDTTIRDWVRKYKQDGIDGLKESRTW
ncbi:helix-turn-helix domain-containing protein, partial [Streptococcus panodentis]